MSNQLSRLVSSGGLVLGSALGLAGSFVPSANLRGLFWGIDGAALVLASSLLTFYFLRKGNEVIAAGFLVFLAGETLVLASAAMGLTSSGPVFGAGVSLWAISLFLVGAANTFAPWIRIAGTIAGALFAIVAVQLFMGRAITPLSQPLPFFAYPILVATLLGWAWERWRCGD
ncbi:MAG: hypothetical protein PVI79_02965 [Gammaproteobacteria bacterium]|jgi:hypothetical protein